jgi:hypothetical protein
MSLKYLTFVLGAWPFQHFWLGLREKRGGTVRRVGHMDIFQVHGVQSPHLLLINLKFFEFKIQET